MSSQPFTVGCIASRLYGACATGVLPRQSHHTCSASKHRHAGPSPSFRATHHLTQAKCAVLSCSVELQYGARPAWLLRQCHATGRRHFSQMPGKGEPTMRPRWTNHTTLKAGTLSILAAGLLMACEHGDRTPTASQPGGGIRGDLLGGTPGGTLPQPPEWLARALSLGELRSDDPRMTSWTDKAEPAPEERPFKVIPFEFDPFGTYLVRARWLRGIGCPTDAHVNDGTTGSDYSDPACLTGDPRDDMNKGLLLVKTGPTANFAAAGAELKNLEGIELVELGYDIRKPGLSANDPRGSHCGAGAPRFNVETTDGLWFIGCNSPPAVSSG